VVVNVYGACNLKDKEALWEEVTDLKSANQDRAWFLCGDFNAVRCASERKGVSERGSQKKEISGFNNFIESNSLVELSLVGKKYSWYKVNGTAKIRIDRVLVTDEWLREWPMAKQYILPREVSDHCAIVVKCLMKDWGPRPFKSIDAWMMEPTFKEMVRSKWCSYAVRGDNITKFRDKLKSLKADLKVWNREVFGHMETEKKRILKEIEDLDVLDDADRLEDHDRMKRLDLIGQVRLVNKKIESLARQKARSKWFVHWDANSKYYHSVIRWRRLRNEVKGVQVGDQWCEEPQVVRREARALFEERFVARHDFGVRLDNVQFKKLTEEESASIVSSITEEEVKEAIWMCEGSKSPGPYGFNFNFIKHNWETIKHDVLAVIQSFEESGIISKGCNASFIALVPKVRDPTKLDEYRPISLVGSLYKIVAKVLSCRMKKVLPAVIDECQSTFLKDRGLLDSVVVANEVVEELKRGGRRGLCLKVDYEKAYDSVSWVFLLDMLQRLGFHSRWIMWIKSCLESATVSVLVNGSPTAEFNATR